MVQQYLQVDVSGHSYPAGHTLHDGDPNEVPLLKLYKPAGHVLQ